jgi:hypothetical protein
MKTRVDRDLRIAGPHPIHFEPQPPRATFVIHFPQDQTADGTVEVFALGLDFVQRAMSLDPGNRVAIEGRLVYEDESLKIEASKIDRVKDIDASGPISSLPPSPDDTGKAG